MMFRKIAVKSGQYSLHRHSAMWCGSLTSDRQTDRHLHTAINFRGGSFFPSVYMLAKISRLGINLPLDRFVDFYAWTEDREYDSTSVQMSSQR